MENIDILIVGAGISGLGLAYYFKKAFPNKKILIVDDRESFGGTWLVHNYPGVRKNIYSISINKLIL